MNLNETTYYMSVAVDVAFVFANFIKDNNINLFEKFTYDEVNILLVITALDFEKNYCHNLQKSYKECLQNYLEKGLFKRVKERFELNNNNELLEMANSLYDLASDMDSADYEEQREEDVQKLLSEIEGLSQDSSLFKCIQAITSSC